MEGLIDLGEKSRTEPTMESSERHETWPQHGFTGIGQLEGLVQVTVAAVTGGAALIHFAVVQEHWEEYWLIGLFFAVIGCLQAILAVMVLARRNQGIYRAVAFVSLSLMAVWWYSRMVGVPIGPHKGMLEDARFADILCTEFETVGLVGAVMLTWPGLVRRQARAWTISLASVAVAASVAWMTNAAIASIGAAGH